MPPTQPWADRLQPLVSVVVAARNAEATLPQLLRSLERQTAQKDTFEVIVVDDASDDETPALVTTSPLARLVSAGAHVGLSGARNIGIRAAKGEVVALTDADCVPDVVWLERGSVRFARGDVDILAGGITVPLGDRPSIATLLDSSRFFDQERYTAMGIGAGANLWIRRELFERIGFFNEVLKAYGDDEDFCRRASRAGARLVYAPGVNVEHPPRRRLRDLARKAYRQGTSFAVQRRHAVTSVRERRKLFLNPRVYVPRRRIYRVERLYERGVHLRRRELRLMHLGQYFCVQLPRLAGDLIGEVKYRRLAGRA